ncbi:chemotaxis protein CheW [Massilia sp. 9096]|uniref:chemotaxis protein CheW n=1 Tax=Massilia sp. 9096 TaxID=1500894 RepID=UPI000AA7E2D7|nr:chemotaxis protein CheW [Massilia sp. 9096]
MFYIGPGRFALPLSAVERVLPLARLAPLPGAPYFVPGLLDLHGEAIPVIDLSRLAGTPPDAVRYDTRILLVEVPALGRMRRLGLQAEHVAGVLELAAEPFAPGVVAAPWLGALARGAAPAPGLDGGLLQLLDPARLLAPETEALLFGETGAP